MKLSTIIGAAFLACGVTAIIPTSAVTNPSPTTPSSTSTSTNLALPTLKTDPFGVLQFGHDGVFRSWAANGTVIDAAPLSNAQLLSHFANAGDEADLKIFVNVNGYDVSHEQIWNPSADLTPDFSAEDDGQKTSHVDRRKEASPPGTVPLYPPPLPAAGCTAIRCTAQWECAQVFCGDCALKPSKNYKEGGCLNSWT